MAEAMRSSEMSSSVQTTLWYWVLLRYLSCIRTAPVQKITMPCRALQVDWCCGGICCACYLFSCLFLAHLIFWLSRWIKHSKTLLPHSQPTLYVYILHMSFHYMFRLQWAIIRWIPYTVH
jgi:hypothetical protein